MSETTGGNGGMSANILDVLQAILVEVRATNHRLDVVTTRLDTLNGRFDNLIDLVSERHADLERRVTALEHKSRRGR